MQNNPIPIIDAILMASGNSLRFAGKNKLLQVFNGIPLAQYTLKLCTELPFINKVFFVCSSNSVAALANNFPVQVLQNNYPENGQSESIRLGVNASTAAHYMFFTCDQPLLNPLTVQTIASHAQKGRIVIPYHKGKPAMPSLFCASYREELLALKAGQNARIIKNQHPQTIFPVEIADANALFDIDTIEDFSRLQTL